MFSLLEIKENNAGVRGGAQGVYLTYMTGATRAQMRYYI